MHVDEVDVAEHRVSAELRVNVHRLCSIRRRVACHDDTVLEHARHVVDDRTHKYREDRLLGAARVAHDGRPQRVADGDEPLDREADCEVD